MSNKPKSISIPEDLLKRMQERARQQNRTLSNYCQNLVRRDLNGEFGRHGPKADSERFALASSTPEEALKKA
jgi:hypothetical protein